MRFFKWVFLIFFGGLALLVVFGLIHEAFRTDEEKAERDARWARQDSLQVVEQIRADSLEQARSIEQAPEDCIRSLRIGNVWPLEEQIKETLLAPSTYEFQRAIIGKDEDGGILVVWEFTAENRFGVPIKHVAGAKVVDVQACADHRPGSTVLLTVNDQW